MARLTDPEILSQYQEALREWDCTGYIKWRRLPVEWVEANLPGQNIKSIAKRMWEHVQVGGEIDQVRELRPEYAAFFGFHYDLRFTVGGCIIYVETVLQVTSTGPEITVVNVHLS